MISPLKNLGLKLVEDANLNEEFSFQRGLINELFPYIYEASKRMSSRGISRWLEANGTKLSAATIAKALRNPQPYWQEIYEDNQPAALIFARGHDEDPEEILKNREFFFLMASKTPVIEGLNHDTLNYHLSEYQGACAKLKEDWFSMSQSMIETCLSNISDEKNAPEEASEASNKERK